MASKGKKTGKNEIVQKMQSPRVVDGVVGVSGYDKILDIGESLFVAVANGDIGIDRAKELRQILELTRRTISDQIRVAKLNTPAIDASHFGASTSSGPFKLVIGGEDSG